MRVPICLFSPYMSFDYDMICLCCYAVFPSASLSKCNTIMIPTNCLSISEDASVLNIWTLCILQFHSDRENILYKLYNTSY